MSDLWVQNLPMIWFNFWGFYIMKFPLKAVFNVLRFVLTHPSNCNHGIVKRNESERNLVRQYNYSKRWNISTETESLAFPVAHAHSHTCAPLHVHSRTHAGPGNVSARGGAGACVIGGSDAGVKWNHEEETHVQRSYRVTVLLHLWHRHMEYCRTRSIRKTRSIHWTRMTDVPGILNLIFYWARLFRDLSYVIPHKLYSYV